MTSFQSYTRLVLYVLAAMLTTSVSGLSTVDFADQKQVAGYFLGIVLSGVVTARAYIDKTPADVTPKSDQA